MFIQNFLSNRVFRVPLGSVYSDIHGQEMGVPQGSILSVTLFILKINSISRITSDFSKLAGITMKKQMNLPNRP